MSSYLLWVTFTSVSLPLLLTAVKLYEVTYGHAVLDLMIASVGCTNGVSCAEPIENTKVYDASFIHPTRAKLFYILVSYIPSI